MIWKIYRYYDMIADDLDFELYCSECGYVAWNETAEDDCPVCSEKKRKRMERKDERTENAAESGCFDKSATMFSFLRNKQKRLCQKE